MKSFLYIFFSAFAVSAVLTPALAAVLRELGFWNARDGEHKKRIVRGGGIAIALTFLLFVLLKEFCSASPLPLALSHLFPSVLVLLFTGVYDDRFGMKPYIKLLCQILAITILWGGGFRINQFLFWPLPWYFSLILTVFWGTAVLNAFNLIDGLDGLCTGNAIISACAVFMIALLNHDRVLIFSTLIFIGSCAGFLLYNVHPAKLFLGDTGSLFLGLICAVFSLRASEGVFNIHNTAVFLLIFWLPFCDLGLAVWRRKVKSMFRSSGCEIMGRDHFHLHYRLLNVVQNHSATVLIMWFGMLSFDFFAILIYIFQMVKITVAVFIAICLFSLIVLARYEISYTSCLIRHLEQLRKNGSLRLSRQVSDSKKSFQN